MADVQRRRLSGMTERDKIAEALKIYRGRDGKDGEPFKFLHCWPLMQHTPKWNDLLTSKKQTTSSKKQKASSSASPGLSTPVSADSCCPNDDDAAVTLSSEALKRPPGKKDVKEKRARSQLSKEQNLYKEAFDDLWSKKSLLEAEKEQKKQECYERAYAQEQERIRIDQENLVARNKELELKTWLEKERIMSIDTVPRVVHV
uniref:No apical meristem-associated C-terminal domain-containing protein n=1 Tax=Arundo donax TaxID=35708 RepID=A0A0A9AH48_ARUDO